MWCGVCACQIEERTQLCALILRKAFGSSLEFCSITLKLDPVVFDMFYINPGVGFYDSKKDFKCFLNGLYKSI